MLLNSMFYLQMFMAATGGGSTDFSGFLNSGITALKWVVIAVGGGLAVLGIINLLEGYGNDNPGAKSQGMKQFMAGAGVMLIGSLLVPELVKLIPPNLS